MASDRESSVTAVVDRSEDLGSGSGPSLEGVIIKKVFRDTQAVAELHAVLSSPRGHYLRLALLHSLRGVLTLDEIERLRKELGVEEYDRHVNKLVKWGLVKPVSSAEGVTGYVRTESGEEAINIVGELERKIGEDRARAIFEAGLGARAIRLFLTIFGDAKEPDVSSREIIYSPLEIGQLMRLFARSVEGISSMDKLDDAGLVSYLDDGNIHVNPRRPTGFYNYLRNLYQLIEKARDAQGRNPLP